MDSDINDFVASMAHKFTVESGARVEQVEGLVLIRYANALIQPTPSPYPFSLEFLAVGRSPDQVVGAIDWCLRGRRANHVVTVFTDQVAEAVDAYDARGYEHAATSPLIACDLGMTPPTAANPARPDGLVIEPLRSSRDVVAYNALDSDYLTSPRAITDPWLHALLARLQGRRVAKAQLVTLPGRSAHVTGLFTALEHRRRGYGTALMAALHRLGRGAGAARVVLVPSAEALEFGFYERLGYRPMTHMLLFVPFRSVGRG
jgi:ribosomal protein S18 acetylase RimI-like enzyme